VCVCVCVSCSVCVAMNKVVLHKLGLYFVLAYGV